MADTLIKEDKAVSDMGDSRSLHFQSDSKGIGEKDIAANGKSARYETILLYISEGSLLNSGACPLFNYCSNLLFCASRVSLIEI